MSVDMQEFPQILRTLIKAANLDEQGFVRDIAQSGLADHRTATAWLGKSSATHAPSRDKLEITLRYFQKKLGLPGLRIEMFYLTAEAFKNQFDELLGTSGKTKEVPVSLPFLPQPLPKGHVDLLCGTYHVSRYSLQGDEKRINREVLAIRNSGDPRILDVEARCVPVPMSHLEKVDPSSLDLFRGTLWRFGGMFSTFLYFENEASRDRRFRHMCFPLLRTGRDTHYGLIMGYSAHLNEPVSARVIAARISEKDIFQQEVDAGAVGPLPVDHPDVKSFAELLDNKIDDGKFVLTVDSRQTPWVEKKK
jgi:hypothetical protein